MIKSCCTLGTDSDMAGASYSSTQIESRNRERQANTCNRPCFESTQKRCSRNVHLCSKSSDKIGHGRETHTLFMAVFQTATKSNVLQEGERNQRSDLPTLSCAGAYPPRLDESLSRPLSPGAEQTFEPCGQRKTKYAKNG